MINFRESEIRDRLAKKLDLIDPNLELIETEFHIQNPLGTSGFIDILARDSVHQHLVVIELKRTNQAARQAIHELFKYTSLLRSEHGLAPTKVRAILVSVEWGELLVPFSSFVRTAAFTVDGYRLELTDSGELINVAKVQPVHENAVLELNPSRSLYLFDKKSNRDSAFDSLTRAFTDSGFPDFVAFGLDYKGTNQRVIYPYGIYVAASRLSEQERERMRESDDMDDIAEFENPWIYEDEATGNVWKQFNSTIYGDLLSDVECSYPEQLGRILSDWVAEPLQRFGRWNQNVTLISDREVLQMLAGIEGASRHLFSAVASPRFEDSWAEFLRKCMQMLCLNPSWSQRLLPYLKRLEQQSSKSTVSVTIHCRDNIVGDVCGVAVYGDPIVLPWLEAVIEDPESSGIKLLLGQLRWSGSGPAPDPISFFDTSFDGFDEFRFARHVGDYSGEEAICNWLQLDYRIYEITLEPETAPSVSEIIPGENGAIEFQNCSTELLNSNMLEYFQSNVKVISALNDLVSQGVVGEDLPDSFWLSDAENGTLRFQRWAETVQSSSSE